MSRKDQHVRPSGERVEFYLGANHQYAKGEAIPITINGHREWAVVGQRNTLPREAVEVLQNAKSRTEVVDVKRYDPSKRGMPRKQEDFYNPQTDYVYQQDFDIEILSAK